MAVKKIIIINVRGCFACQAYTESALSDYIIRYIVVTVSYLIIVPSF